MAFRTARRALALGAACAALLGSSVALAATAEETAGARAAAIEGAAAYKEGRWQDALDMFTRAEGLVHSPVHLLYLARVHAQLGHLVLAKETYVATIREHVEPDAPPAFNRAKEQAAEELKTLEPRIPKLKLQVNGAPVEAVVVKMDGKEYPPLLIGVPRPVDPGAHEVEVTGNGVTPMKQQVEIAEGERKSAELDVQYDAAAAAAAAEQASAEEESGEPSPPGGSAPDGRDEAPEEGGNGLRIASYAAAGVGVVGLGLGIGFGLSAMSKQDEASGLCNDQGCPESRRSEIATLDDEASSANTLSIIGFAVGGVGLAAAVALFIPSMSSGDSASSTEPSVTPFVGLGSAGVSGQF